MNKKNTDDIVMVASKEPYIVNGVIWLPIALMQFYIFFDSNGNLSWLLAGIIGLTIIVCIFSYLHTLRLAITNNKINYHELWNVKELFLEEVISIKQGSKLFHVKVRWLVEAKDPSKSFIVNTANFDRKKMKMFVKKLHEIAPNIDVQV